MIKKLLSFIAGAALAVSAALPAAAEDIEVKVSGAQETSDGISYHIPESKFLAAQMQKDAVLNISYSGGEDAAESPVKLIVTYWDSESSENGGAGAPATAEIIPEEFADGTAKITNQQFIKATGSIDFSPVIDLAVAANGGSTIKCTNVTAEGVLSRDELAAAGTTTAVSIDTSAAKESSNWGQSISVNFNEFDGSRMTTTTKVIATFECDEEGLEASPAELILQSWEYPDSPKASADGKIWAKIPAESFSDNYAVFSYVDMIEGYGTADFTQLSSISIGDTGTAQIKCTGLYITDCKPTGSHKTDEDEDSADESGAEESETEEVSEEEKPAETTTTAATTPAPETTTAAASDSSSSGSNIVFVIIGVVAGIAIAVAALFIILGRKSKETYDVQTHKFIKK